MITLPSDLNEAGGDGLILRLFITSFLASSNLES